MHYFGSTAAGLRTGRGPSSDTPRPRDDLGLGLGLGVAPPTGPPDLGLHRPRRGVWPRRPLRLRPAPRSPTPSRPVPDPPRHPTVTGPPHPETLRVRTGTSLSSPDAPTLPTGPVSYSVTPVFLRGVAPALHYLPSHALDDTLSRHLKRPRPNNFP